MPTETIADIVREMREYNDVPPPRRAWLDLADRIEAAAKREKELSLAICDKCEAGVFKAENDRLRAALLTICTADRTAEGLREIAIDAMNNRVAKAVKESEAK